jgi:hypothetical protein
MWPWQVHFRISCQTSAESLFNELDRGLQSTIFLLGFLIEEHEDRLPICIDPEDLHYRIKEFANIETIANEIYETDEDRTMLYSGGMQQEMNMRLRHKSFRLAIEKILNESEHNSGKLYFSSSFVLVEGYRVFVIIELNREVYESHSYLEKSRHQERVKIYRSLLETTVKSYLDDRKRCLCLPEPGKNMESRLSEELLRESARHFMYTISSKGEEFYGLHGLFDACNKISISRYEGIENTGHLLIAKKEHPDIEMTLELDTPFNLSDYRKSRKILQLSNNEVGVVCNSYEVLGLGKLKTSYDASTESIFSIQFKGIHCWDIIHNNQILFQMRFGLPQFHREAINKDKFFSDAKRIFSTGTINQIENLYTLAIASTKQNKGAMLVISNNASAEADRLSKQCINIKPIKLDSNSILNLTSIDGGVLLDPDGIAYAQGVILDGIVGTKGDSARGSRYNSAITYYEHKGLNDSIMIIVVSEDGMVDVIPTLMPQIKHSEIMQVISILEKLSSESDFDRGAFNQAMNWLKNREFYLTITECEKINLLRAKIDEINKHASMRIVHEDLHPNQDMNSSYYIEE